MPLLEPTRVPIRALLGCLASAVPRGPFRALLGALVVPVSDLQLGVAAGKAEEPPQCVAVEEEGHVHDALLVVCEVPLGGEDGELDLVEELGEVWPGRPAKLGGVLGRAYTAWSL